MRSKGVDEGMSVEQNLRMVDAAFEAINDQDWDHLWGLHVDNIVMSAPDLPDPVKGREAVQERLQAWGDALPDLSWKRVHGFGQGDWVCVELVISGTQDRKSTRLNSSHQIISYA